MGWSDWAMAAHHTGRCGVYGCGRDGLICAFAQSRPLTGRRSKRAGLGEGLVHAARFVSGVVEVAPPGLFVFWAGRSRRRERDPRPGTGE